MDKKFLYGAAVFMCLVAVFPLPYSFYTFLRLVVSVTAVVAAIELQSEDNFLWILFGGITLLFNPLFLVHLEKEVWFPIDLFVAGCFGWMVFRNA